MQKQAASKADKVLCKRQRIRIDKNKDGTDGDGQYECLHSQNGN